MITPTIHLNGTSKAELLEQLRNAYTAVRNAQKVLQEAAPNGRDYYPQGPGAILQAQSEYESRLTRLQDVAKELEEIQEAIYEQGGKK